MPGNVKWRIIKKFLIIFFHEEHSNQYNFVIFFVQYKLYNNHAY
jgi:hypothetical protein